MPTRLAKGVARAGRAPGCGLALLAWAGLWGGPAAALTGSSAEVAEAGSATDAAAPPTFLIESIVVEGARHASPDLIVAESLLRPGRTYTEADLRLAVYRLQRLPFILDAQFRLARGSARGTYQLVVTVEETRRLFFATDGRLTWSRQRALSDSAFGDRFSTRPTVGLRAFTGSHGVAFVAFNGFGYSSSSLTGDDFSADLQAGYSHYDLFHRGVAATVAYSLNEVEGADEVFPLGLDPSFTTWSLGANRRGSFALAAPMGGSRSARFAAVEIDAEAASRTELLPPSNREPLLSFHGDLRYRRAELRWVDDTTDDPVVPTRGRLASAGIAGSRLEARRDPRFQPDVEDPGRARSPAHQAELVTVFGELQRHWPLRPRQSLSLSGRAALGRSRVEEGEVGRPTRLAQGLDSYEAGLGLGYALALLPPATAREAGDFRLEARLRLSVEGTSPALGSTDNPLGRLDLVAALVFRNAWGLFRLSVSYVDLRGV